MTPEEKKYIEDLTDIIVRRTLSESDSIRIIVREEIQGWSNYYKVNWNSLSDMAKWFEDMSESIKAGKLQAIRVVVGLLITAFVAVIGWSVRMHLSR